jgi:Dipeptidyl peptidase IV (DPP IV) N-terminal region
MKHFLIKLIYKVKQSFSVILIALLGYSTIAQADTSKLIIFRQNVLFKHDVLRAYASGKLEKVFSVKGPPSTLIISPDQNYIVYNLENDLWLLNMQTKQTTRLTNIGKSTTSQYASVDAMGKLWSWDSNKIIYEVMAGDIDDPEGTRPTLKVRSTEYGFYVYDLKTRINRPIELPKVPKRHILFWLENGNFLIGTDNKIVLHDVINNTERPLGFESNASQTSLSYDGKFVLATINNKMTMSQIAKADMPQGHVTPITPAGKFTEYQWARFSPSAKRIAYEHSIGKENGFPVIILVVDGRDIYKCIGYLSYTWIDDSTIVLIEEKQKEAVIIDVDTKQVKGRHNLKE